MNNTTAVGGDNLPRMPEPFILLQHLLPKRALTESIGRLAAMRGGALTTAAIRGFIRRYRVDMSEAADPRPQAYESFNDFFTRALRDDARPMASADWVCPVDGAVSQLGPIEAGRIFQAKGHAFDCAELLGQSGSVDLAQAHAARVFEDGQFATIYLSPRDYHRIHMPCAGELRHMCHVPGALYSVNPLTVQNIPALFARNERVVCHFDTEHGPLVLVLVGATIVGSMATTWHGQVNPPRPGQVRRWNYAPGQVSLKRGEEMGRFLLGSTVILLWPAGAARFEPGWFAGRPVRLGESMAQRLVDNRATVLETRTNPRTS
ncbi:MAG: archaetidylserine decarboxylase [Burkholderiaceae bacterium]